MKDLVIFLVRHEDAEDHADGPDAHRALTAKGRRRMRKSARLWADQSERLDFIYTSPLVRAVQTAEIIALELGIDEPVLAREAIVHPKSWDDITHLLKQVPNHHQGVAIVGHEPSISTYAAHLLKLAEFPRPFKKGMIVAIRVSRKTLEGDLRWLIMGDGPRLLHALDD